MNAIADPKPIRSAVDVAAALPERRTTDRRRPEPAIVAALKAERAARIDTLHGAALALAQVLAVVDAIAYTRALRVQRLALDLARARSLDEPWEIASAAVLAPLGMLSLVGDLQQRAQAFDALDSDEQRVLASLPRLTDRLLAPIPGMEAVRSVILLRHQQPLQPEHAETFGVARVAELRLFGAVLRVADEFDMFVSRGLLRAEALGLLRNESVAGDSELVDLLAGLHAGQDARVEVRSLPLARLRTGMVIAEAVYTTAGQLLVNRGFEINDAFLSRIGNFRRGLVREPVQVILPDAAAGSATDSADGKPAK